MKRFQKILVHVDSRMEAHPVVDRAISLAKDHGARIKVCDVMPELSWPKLIATSSEEVQASIRAKKQANIDALVALAQSHGVPATGVILSGKTSVQLVAEVKNGGHDLVMKQAKGTSSQSKGVFGTSATHLMRYCPSAVWAFRPNRSPGGDRIVAAVDVAAEGEQHIRLNHQILDTALGLIPGRTPDVLNVWHVYRERFIQDYMKRDEFEVLVKDAHDRARIKMAELLKEFGLSIDSPSVHMLHGAEAEEIPNFVNKNNYDVLVMGTVGRSGVIGFLIGNTAETLLNLVECSLLAVRPDDFVSPIRA